jgi:hypothetical protein
MKGHRSIEHYFSYLDPFSHMENLVEMAEVLDHFLKSVTTSFDTYHLNYNLNHMMKYPVAGVAGVAGSAGAGVVNMCSGCKSSDHMKWVLVVCTEL